MEMKVDVRALMETFTRLPDKVQLKAARGAIRAGANVMKAQAVKNIQSLESSEATHTLEKSLQVSKFKDSQGGRVRYAVRIRPKSVNATKKDKHGNPVRVGLYGAVLNWGGKKRHQPAWAWLTKAAKEHVPEVLRAVEDGFKKNFDKAVAAARGK